MISKVREYLNFNLGQIKVYELMFEIELSMEKLIKKKLGCWIFRYTRDNCFWL